eukprot:1258852-Rhodomonas_salina.1
MSAMFCSGIHSLSTASRTTYVGALHSSTHCRVAQRVGTETARDTASNLAERAVAVDSLVGDLELVVELGDAARVLLEALHDRLLPPLLGTRTAKQTTTRTEKTREGKGTERKGTEEKRRDGTAKKTTEEHTPRQTPIIGHPIARVS